MKCPACGGATAVKDSRPAKLDSGRQAIRRRRHCLVCPQRWSTMEVLVSGDRRYVQPDYPQLLHHIAQQLKLIQDDIDDLIKGK